MKNEDIEIRIIDITVIMIIIMIIILIKIVINTGNIFVPKII